MSQSTSVSHGTKLCCFLRYLITYTAVHGIVWMGKTLHCKTDVFTIMLWGDSNILLKE